MTGSRRLLGHGTVQSCDHKFPPDKEQKHAISEKYSEVCNISSSTRTILTTCRCIKEGGA